MGRRVSMSTKSEVLELLRPCYRSATRLEKGRILDEFVGLSGHHRKHAIRLLNQMADPERKERQVRRIYDEAVRQALVILWEASDRLCGKRLKVMLPVLVEALERHGHLALDDELRERLLAVSPATIDRLLSPTRERAGRKRRRSGPASAVRRRIPVRTFSDWGSPPPGYFEADFVAHHGGSMAGSFLYTFVVTDIASGWTEGLPLVARQQDLVVAALDVFRQQLPVEMKGFDTDNDSAFMNETVFDYLRLSNTYLEPRSLVTAPGPISLRGRGSRSPASGVPSPSPSPRRAPAAPDRCAGPSLGPRAHRPNLPRRRDPRYVARLASPTNRPRVRVSGGLWRFLAVFAVVRTVSNRCTLALRGQQR